MHQTLFAALNKLAAMKAPSVESILTKRGYPYEASVIADVLREYEAAKASPSPESAAPTPGSTAVHTGFLLNGVNCYCHKHLEECPQPGHWQGAAITVLLDKWDAGELEFMTQLAAFASTVDELCERAYQTLGDDGFPGAFEYEVTEEVGADIAAYILSTPAWRDEELDMAFQLSLYKHARAFLHQCSEQETKDAIDNLLAELLPDAHIDLLGSDMSADDLHEHEASKTCPFQDVDILERSALDDDRAKLFSKPWLVVYADNRILELDTEAEACACQRFHRLTAGRDPMTGDPLNATQDVAQAAVVPPVAAVPAVDVDAQELKGSTAAMVEPYAESIIKGKPEDFDAIEIHGVRNFATPEAHGDGTFCEIVDADPEFFSVYLHSKYSGVMCVGDFGVHPLAVAYAEELSQQYDWPVYDHSPVTAERDLPLVERLLMSGEVAKDSEGNPLATTRPYIKLDTSKAGSETAKPFPDKAIILLDGRVKVILEKDENESLVLKPLKTTQS